MLLVDFLACTLRRVPLAGLPLLTIFSVPLSMLGTGPSWYVFALTAAGFLAMLFVHEDEQVSRWGRALERDRGGGRSTPSGCGPGRCGPTPARSAASSPPSPSWSRSRSRP